MPTQTKAHTEKGIQEQKPTLIKAPRTKDYTNKSLYGQKSIRKKPTPLSKAHKINHKFSLYKRKLTRTKWTIWTKAQTKA